MSDTEYNKALFRIEYLIKNAKSDQEVNELQYLAMKCDEYESEHFPIEL